MKGRKIRILFGSCIIFLYTYIFLEASYTPLYVFFFCQYRIGGMGSARNLDRSTLWSNSSSSSPIRVLDVVSTRKGSNFWGGSEDTHIMSPLTRYSPKGTSSTRVLSRSTGSTSTRRSLESERTTFDFWSKPDRMP